MIASKGEVFLRDEGLERPAPAADNPATAEEPGWGDEHWLEIETLSAGTTEIEGMVVKSAPMQELVRRLKLLGPYRTTVLLHGESGCGKELAARALHAFGKNPKAPFVTFNCSNLVESLAESQLFGHVRGAFTDAREDAQGYFRAAHGGTLFLDEIGELPLRLQPKLLRAVELHEVQAVGSAHPYHVDIRLVAATNRDLLAMVKAGLFRDDLYYRLNASSVRVPPLRERREAVAALAAWCVRRCAAEFGKEVRWISAAALRVLLAYDWPGNVRELAHAMQSAVVLATGARVGVEVLPEELKTLDQGAGRPLDDCGPEAGIAASAAGGPEAAAGPHLAQPAPPAKRPPMLEAVIKGALLRSLEETEGNRRRAAALLGVSRSTLYRMLSRYGVDSVVRRREKSGVFAGSG